MAQRLCVGSCGVAHVEKDGAHAGGDGAVDIALLVVHKDAVRRRNPQPLRDEREGSGVWLQDAGIGGIDDQVEGCEEGKLGSNSGP